MAAPASAAWAPGDLLERAPPVPQLVLAWHERSAEAQVKVHLASDSYQLQGCPPARATCRAPTAKEPARRAISGPFPLASPEWPRPQRPGLAALVRGAGCAAG